MGTHKGFILAQRAGPQNQRNRVPADEKVGPYWRRTLVPLIYWLLSVFRKLGISLSINSKYDDRAGVV